MKNSKGVNNNSNNNNNNCLEFWDTYGSPNLGQTTTPSDSQKKKKKRINSGLCCSSWTQSKTEKWEER